MRYNNVRDFEANLLETVHNDVETEPDLQLVTNEQITGLTNGNARPDIRARGVWRHRQNTYFDVRITNVTAKTKTY